MARIIGMDFGTKRTGLAVTDPQRIIVNPLATVNTAEVIMFLQKYMAVESVDLLVCGHPGKEHKETVLALDQFIGELRAAFPKLPVEFQDEHYTSARATQIIRESGQRKMKRRDKSLVDTVSAILILQEYLGHLN